MNDYIAAPERVRNKNNSGPAKDCTEYSRDCACWRCLKHFNLQVADFQFRMLRKYGAQDRRRVYARIRESERQHDRESISYQLTLHKTNA